MTTAGVHAVPRAWVPDAAHEFLHPVTGDPAIAVPFHDAAHEVIPEAHGTRDYFTTCTDADGDVVDVHANSGHLHLANVTADSRFVYPED